MLCAHSATSPNKVVLQLLSNPSMDRILNSLMEGVENAPPRMLGEEKVMKGGERRSWNDGNVVWGKWWNSSFFFNLGINVTRIFLRIVLHGIEDFCIQNV